MAKAAQKITLNKACEIPLDRLVLSDANVRHVQKDMAIEQLADDIARGNMLQSLSVRPLLDEEGGETGDYQVQAGGRRFRALQLLVRQKRLAKDAPVPCIVRTEGLAEDDSLRENDQRVGIHPLDQFRAFKAMRDKGLSEDEIAARHFVKVETVRQRLRLATVSPKLLELYVEDKIKLTQLMAFTIAEDHARQEQVWDIVSRGYNREAYYIRRLLTENTVNAEDYRVRFVGLDAYERAGGIVLRDLFEQDGGGWVQDVPLLDSLALAKLKAAAGEVAAEGWKWVDAALSFPHGTHAGARRLEGASTLTAEQEARYQALLEELEEIETGHPDLNDYDPADEDEAPVIVRYEEVAREIGGIEALPLSYDPAGKAIAGALVSIGRDGLPRVERGIVRSEDEPAADAAEGEAGEEETVETSGRKSIAVITIGGEPADGEDASAGEEDEPVKPLPDSLMLELTGLRSVALQNAVADHPDVAMTLLLHKLCAEVFHHDRFGGCLETRVNETRFVVQGPDLKTGDIAGRVKARRDAWRKRLPAEDGALWDHLSGLDGAARAELLAFCVSLAVNAVNEPVKYPGGRISSDMVRRRLFSADRVARAVGLDIAAEGWQPTSDNYLGRVPKVRILEAVREGRGERAAGMIGHLKKGDMAREAERLLAGTGWVPEPLRLEEAEAPVSEGDADLPDFLDGDGDDDDGDEPDGDELLDAAE